MKRSIACFLACIMTVSLLCACTATKKSAAVNYWQETTPEQIPETIPEQTIAQQPMPQEELKQALMDVDFSVLCADLDVDFRHDMIRYYQVNLRNCTVAYADHDDDGYPEILQKYTDYDLSGGREIVYHGYPIADVDSNYYTDNAGMLYKASGWYDCNDYISDAPHLTVHTGGESYSIRKNGTWEKVITFSYRVSSDDPAVELSYEALADPSNYVTYDVEAEWYGQSCDVQEYLEKRKESGIKLVDTMPATYTVNYYDASYRDSLLNALDVYFAEHYDAYTQMLTIDVDDDGQTETVYLIPDFNNVWNKAARLELESGNDFDGDPNAIEDSRTGIVVADTQADRLVIRAYCAEARISAYEGMTVHMEDCFLRVDNAQAFICGSMTNTSDIPNLLNQFLASYGYKDCIIRSVDVCDREGEEYLCIGNKDGKLRAFLIIILDGSPVVWCAEDLSDSAIYLLEEEGKQYILLYKQYTNGVSSRLTTNYSYTVYRVDQMLEYDILDSGYISYSDQDKDATKVAKFFEEFNKYLIKIITVYDPYELTGKRWMDQSDVQYGTIPQEQNQPGENEKPVMGFVQIQDPSSWLNLREGPGTEYARVLMDPFDPNSFVRQAQGSPVTVLETITTGDPENPVWLKIRITYANREIIGYSSKTYIRLVDE
ncbi:MAG: hypothetical protein IKW10_08200 [Oscillospiraceae bacterium]|nr:hypothetical protein [Oscillospiraceae bacterium]